MKNLSFKITLPSSFSGSVSVNLQRASLSLSRNSPGASFSSCSVFCLPVWHSLKTYFKVTCSPESFKNTSDKMTLIPSSFSCVVVPIWFYNWDSLIPTGESGYLILPLPYQFITKPFISTGNCFSQNSSS